MFEVFSVKRVGGGWEVHIENGTKVKTATMSNTECAVYMDKAAELMEDLANKDYRAVGRDME